METIILNTIVFEALKNRGFFSNSVSCYKELKGKDRAEIDRAISQAVELFGSKLEAVKNYSALYDWTRYEYELDGIE